MNEDDNNNNNKKKYISIEKNLNYEKKFIRRSIRMALVVQVRFPLLP